MSSEPEFAWAVISPDVGERQAATGESAAGFVLTPARLRVWGMRSALSLVDQGLASGAGFTVNLLLARWMAPETYGAFAVAFAGFLFVSGFHNVLLLEPLSVFGPSRHAEELPAYFRTQIAMHTLLTGALSAVTLLGGLVLWRMAPGSRLIGAVLGGGLALPFLLLAWLARRMCYVVQRPSAAVLGSGFYLAFVVAGLLALGRLGWLGSFAAFLLMASGSVLAACLLLWRLRLLKGEPGLEGGVRWRAALRENWTYGRWLVGSTVLNSISNQTQMFLAAAMLGLGSAGILRAMQLPSLVMTQVVFAAGAVILPAFSYDFGRGAVGRMQQKAGLVSLGLGVLAGCFAGVLGLFAGRVEHLLFGGKYAAFAQLIWVLALIPVAQGFSIGSSMALRALQRPQFDLVANGVAALVGVVSAIFFMHRWGVAGAAVSLVASFAAYAISTCWSYYSSRRSRRKEGLET